MKSGLKYILIAVGVIVAGAAITASGIYSSNKARDRFMENPQISSREELEEALAGEKQTYCLINMPVSGTAAEDSLGILNDEYMYIYYAKENCKEEMNKTTGEREYKWGYTGEGSIDATYGTDMVLFEEYPVTAKEYTAIMDANVLTPDMVKDEYKDLTDGSYYPNGVGDRSGNTRYTLAALPMGQEVAMYATVGDGEIIMENNEDALCYIVSGGTMESLGTYYGSDSGMMRTLIGIMLVVPVGFMMLVTMIVFSITSAIAKKSAEKKGAAKKNSTKSVGTKSAGVKKNTTKPGK